MTVCSYCGGALEEQRVQHDYRWEGELFIFEDVPAHVCRQCGEKYFHSGVVKAMERAVLRHLKPKRILQVPVFSYRDVGLA
jgi:YgiT-type zinc finger domain-containing protein